MFTLKVTHGKFSHEVKVPGNSTIGDLKQVLVEEVFLRPEDQRLLFRGREVADGETLEAAGVLDRSKLMLLESGAAHEKKKEESAAKEEGSKASAAVIDVHNLVDTYATQVKALEASVTSGEEIGSKDIALLQELLMRQLLKLDAIVAEGDVKQQRRKEVKRVQALVDELDRLKGECAQRKSQGALRTPSNTPTKSSSPAAGSTPPVKSRGTETNQGGEQNEGPVNPPWVAFEKSASDSALIGGGKDSPVGVGVGVSRQSRPGTSTSPREFLSPPPNPLPPTPNHRSPSAKVEQDVRRNQEMGRSGVGSLPVRPPAPQLSSLSVSTSKLGQLSVSSPVSEGSVRSSPESVKPQSPSFADTASTFPATALPRGSSSSPPAAAPAHPTATRTRSRAAPSSGLSSFSSFSMGLLTPPPPPPADPFTTFPSGALPRRSVSSTAEAGEKGRGEGRRERGSPAVSNTSSRGNSEPPTLSRPNSRGLPAQEPAKRGGSSPKTDAPTQMQTPRAAPAPTPPPAPTPAQPVPNFMDEPFEPPSSTLYPSIQPATSWLADIPPPAHQSQVPNPDNQVSASGAAVIKYDPSMGQVYPQEMGQVASYAPPSTLPAQPPTQPGYFDHPYPAAVQYQHGQQPPPYNGYPYPYPQQTAPQYLSQSNGSQFSHPQYQTNPYQSGPYPPALHGYPGYPTPPPTPPHSFHPQPGGGANASLGLFPSHPSRMSDGGGAVGGAPQSQPWQPAEWEKFLPPRRDSVTYP